MFEYFNGILVDKYSTATGYYIILDVNSVGYSFEVSEKDYNSDLKINEPLKIFSKLIHKEDNMYLCGFLKKENRDIFNYLLSVSGVGIKMALALLGAFETCDLISMVINEEYKQLTLAKGVGVKLAQKIILELRDKLIKANIMTVSDKITGFELTKATQETTSILLSLGYTDEEINNAYKVVLSKCVNKDDAEELLRETLKYLSM